jgi:3-deoxy-manno-octulosonate cytidylyltransferase (CMP-KDO synthetase)
MKHPKKIVCIIPARLESTRFPRKMLATLGGRPLLSWVWDAARSIDLFDSVYFAVDTEEIAALITSFGGKFKMTSISCKSGTDRLIELNKHGSITADIWVNWQGDEPFVAKPMIISLLQSIAHETEEMWTLKKRITNPNDICSPNFAKVVSDHNNHALYFSRAPIPFFRDESNPEELVKKQVYYKHVGLYAFTSQALQKIALMGSSVLEDAEKLEQNRFLDYGLKIRLHETDYDVRGIDTPQDLAHAEEIIRQMKR